MKTGEDTTWRSQKESVTRNRQLQETQTTLEVVTEEDMHRRVYIQSEKGIFEDLSSRLPTERLHRREPPWDVTAFPMLDLCQTLAAVFSC